MPANEAEGAEDSRAISARHFQGRRMDLVLVFISGIITGLIISAIVIRKFLQSNSIEL